MASGSRNWFRKQFGDKFEEKGREIGRFNLAIFGKTGVGKSTLINAIFGKDVAATGIGAPVTQGSHLYLHADGHFGVLDTRGLEIGADDGTILGELEEYVQGMRQAPLHEQVHVAWYCVRASDRRFEDTEEAFIRALDRLGLQVLLVLTQVPMRDGAYHPDTLELVRQIELRDLPLRGEPLYLTNAKADEFAGLPPHGLQGLLDATFRAAPQGVQEALTAAQKIDLTRKRASADKAIAAAVASAMAAGATPIPFSDAVILVPLQAGHDGHDRAHLRRRRGQGHRGLTGGHRRRHQRRAQRRDRADQDGPGRRHAGRGRHRRRCRLGPDLGGRAGVGEHLRAALAGSVRVDLRRPGQRGHPGGVPGGVQGQRAQAHAGGNGLTNRADGTN
jgi:GTP-binding protein EngB required for normal cell division